MNNLLFFLFCLPVLGQSQSSHSTKFPTETEVVAKGSKAVVNLKCKSNFFVSKLFVKMLLLDRKNPNVYTNGYTQKVQDSIRRIQYSGTAIYFKHKKTFFYHRLTCGGRHFILYTTLDL